MSLVSGPWTRVAEAAGLIGENGVVAPTIFAEMSALAARTGAINLGQGFPDEDGPPEVLDEARAAILRGANQYPPGRGTAELREAIAEHDERFYGLTTDPETEIVVTAGATEALTATLLALVDGPEDEVVVFDPAYDAYAAAVALAGGRLVRVPLRFPEFAPDPAELTAAVSDRTRIILVNDPHNPTGAVLSADTRALLVELAERHDAIIVTDEVYEHLTFTAPHVPIATLPGAWARTIRISSAGKTFSTTGWKIGWATGPAELITAVLTVKQYLTYVNGSPFQPAIARGLGLEDAFFRRVADDLGKRQQMLAEGLGSLGMPVSVPAAGYFTIADAGALGYRDAAALCRQLPELVGVVGIPVSAFASAEHRHLYDGLIRFAACKRRSVISEALARLSELPRGGRG